MVQPLGERACVDQFVSVDAGSRRRGDVSDIVHAGSAGRKADLLKFEQTLDHVPRRDFPDLEVCARSDIGVTATPFLGDLCKAPQLRRGQFTSRDPAAELTGLPELDVTGLPDQDARALLASALPGPLDARVRDLIVAETRGNPLALLELPRGLNPRELAGGFGLPGAGPLAGAIEYSFARQLSALPP